MHISLCIYVSMNLTLSLCIREQVLHLCMCVEDVYMVARLCVCAMWVFAHICAWWYIMAHMCLCMCGMCT